MNGYHKLAIIVMSSVVGWAVPIGWILLMAFITWLIVEGIGRDAIRRSANTGRPRHD